MWATGCAGGSRAKGTVLAGHERQDDFLRGTQLLIARVERAEAAATSPLWSDTPPGVRVFVEGEGPAARVDVGGEAEPEVLLRAVAVADDLAAAPPRMDAVPAEAERLEAQGRKLSVEIFAMPGPRGARVRQAFADAMRLLGELPERARRAGRAARDRLARLRPPGAEAR